MQSICWTAFFLTFFGFFTIAARAAELDVKIGIEGSTAVVRGVFTAPQSKSISFVRSVAGIPAEAGRLSEFKLFDESGKAIDVRRLASDEYVAAAPFVAWSCRFDLSPVQNINSKAHLSWLDGKNGILMLRDLLPELPRAMRTTVEIRTDSTVITNEKSLGASSFEVNNTDRAIFYLAEQSESAAFAAGAARFRLVISGQWQTETSTAVRAISDIFDRYEKAYGRLPVTDAIVYLGKFPDGTNAGRWAAETRGSNVTIFSSEMSFKTQSVQKLHEQLRHELFHLWFPNSMNLSGNYDWFYEGFALYSSLKTGVAMNRLRFEDFLDTLSRAYDIERAARRRLSLIDASKERWNGNNTQVYARGMIVAFLTDAAILNKTKGRESFEVLLARLYDRHGSASPRSDANDAILKLFGERAELAAIAERYVKSAADIDWSAEISSVGIEPANATGPTKLRVRSKLDGRQKDLLDKLGYNNWRKKSE